MENWSMNLGLLVMATFAKTTEVTARRSTVDLRENIFFSKAMKIRWYKDCHSSYLNIAMLWFPG